MASWKNLIIHITLPKGLKLGNGQVLLQPVTFSVTGGISPYYCSIDQIRLHGGTYMQKLGDLTIASEIYEISKTTDGLTYRFPPAPINPYDVYAADTRKYNRFVDARQKFVSSRAATELILNIWDIAGARGSHTLGNLSIQRQSVMRDEGLPKKLLELETEADKFKIIVQSGGDIGYGGHVPGTMAARGAYGGDPPAGRLWINTGIGIGAGEKSLPGYGSFGKPVKYSSAYVWEGGYGVFSQGWFSPPLSQFRAGMFMGAYPAVYSPVAY
jgi:hypothetical protein